MTLLLLLTEALVMLVLSCSLVFCDILGTDVADGTAKEGRIVIVGVGATYCAMLVVVVAAQKGILLGVVHLG